MDILERETCPVCGKTGLKYFARTQCSHTPEEWGRSVGRRVAETLCDLRTPTQPQSNGE